MLPVDLYYIIFGNMIEVMCTHKAISFSLGASTSFTTNFDYVQKNEFSQEW